MKPEFGAAGTRVADPSAKVFPILERPPVVEAVIEFRVRAGDFWDAAEAEERIRELLPEYPNVERIERAEFEASWANDGAAPEIRHRVKYPMGLLFKSSEASNIVQFQSDRVARSRLQPYTNWDELEAEALRLWNVYQKVRTSVELNGIGVRFINRIPLTGVRVDLGEVLRNPPSTPHGLDVPFIGFLHQDVLKVPDTPYQVKIVKTLQAGGGSNALPGLILDCDVQTEPGLIPEAEMLNQLARMRELKNHAFFGTVSEKSIEAFL
jgi:uncharacterized protein (TIGR04255 family)